VIARGRALRAIVLATGVTLSRHAPAQSQEPAATDSAVTSPGDARTDSTITAPGAAAASSARDTSLTIPPDAAQSATAPDSAPVILSPSDSAEILIGSPDTIEAFSDTMRIEAPPQPFFDPYASHPALDDSDRVYRRGDGVESGSRTPLEPLRELRSISLERFGYLGQSERLSIAGDENVALAIAGAPVLPSRSGLPPYEVLPTEALSAAGVRDAGGSPFLAGRGSAGSLEWDVAPRLGAAEEPATTAFAERGPFDFRAYRASLDRRVGPVRGNIAYQASWNRLFGDEDFARARGSSIALASEDRWRVPIFVFATGTRQELDLSLSADEEASGRGTEERGLVIARTEIAVEGVRRLGVMLKLDRVDWRASDAAELRGHQRESGVAITLGEPRALSFGTWGYAGRVVDERGAQSRDIERIGAVVRFRGGFGESGARGDEGTASDTLSDASVSDTLSDANTSDTLSAPSATDTLSAPSTSDTLSAAPRDTAIAGEPTLSAHAIDEEIGTPESGSSDATAPGAGAQGVEPDYRFRWDLHGGGEHVSHTAAREHFGASVSAALGSLHTTLAAARAHDHPPQGLLLPSGALAPARKTTAGLSARTTIAAARVGASVLHRWADDAIFLSASDPFYADVLRESYEEWAGVFDAAAMLPLRIEARAEYQFTRDDAVLPLPLRAEHRGRFRLGRDFPLSRPDAVLSFGATLEAASERVAFDRVTLIPESIDLRANVRIAAAGAIFFMQAENLLDRCNYVLPYDANNLSLGCETVALGVLPEGRSFNFGLSWTLRN
jgi:hypothetical protein